MKNPNNYWKILRKANDLYEAGKYQEVIDFLKEGVKKYPDLKPAQYYSRICAATKLQKYELALGFLREILDEGGWYSEMVLRQSPSLQPLQGMVEFEKLLEISVERSKEASKEDHNVTVFPDKFDSPYPLLLALHADGGLIKEEYEAWKTVVDHGYVLGMPRSTNLYWSGKDGAHWTTYESGANQVKNYVNKLNIYSSVDLESTILGGLSMGGGLAIRLALLDIIPVRGFVVVAPGGPEMDEPEKWQSLINDAKNRNLRGIIILGEEDTAVPREDIKKLAMMLNDGNIPCEFIEYPDLDHWYPPNFAEIVTSFIANLSR